MKLLSTAALAIVVACAPAYAETFRATITKVEPNWGYRDVSVPTTHCQNVEVPVYGTVQGGGASGGDVLAGMIIGGLLGKGITNKDNGAAAGAVLGGVIAADKNQSKQTITGYRTETQCQMETRYEETERSIYSHSTVRFWHEGQRIELKFHK